MRFRVTAIDIVPLNLKGTYARLFDLSISPR
jgi:hypothetical protein